jgi:hypothetical protein
MNIRLNIHVCMYIRIYIYEYKCEYIFSYIYINVYITYSYIQIYLGPLGDAPSHYRITGNVDHGLKPGLGCKNQDVRIRL